VKVRLISVGTKMPDWIAEGFTTYQKRLPVEFELQLVEIPLPRRSKGSNIDQCVNKETTAMLSMLGRDEHVVALDERGRSFSTRELASRIERLRDSGGDVALLVGGPDGLGTGCLARADERWSLSALTLPHPLVRVVLAEQLYRVWSLLSNHPYHRD
jgi:23S rRNA (pseudouridine1915-N3)-methyltransferase